MNFFPAPFKRKFAISLYKNLKIKLGEMSFYKDFVTDQNGDPYPIHQKSADCDECVKNNTYLLSRGSVSRILCQFFPFATYEVTFTAKDGRVGFGFLLPHCEAYVIASNTALYFTCGDHEEQIAFPTGLSQVRCLIVSCRPRAFDIYLKVNQKPEFLCTVYEEAFCDSNREAIFSAGYTCLHAAGEAVIKEVSAYIDNGISIADIRPIKYEDGSVMTEDGRVYFTASIRMQEGTFQGVFSWIPTTAEFDMTGVTFYDCGDKTWRSYVAPVFVYHRKKKEWLVWVSSFAHEHILAHGTFVGDPRFGVNVIDVTFMERASDTSSHCDFVGFGGDEDPDLLYDEKNDRWLLAICRRDPHADDYVYYFFESHHPFQNYRYIGKGRDGAETGGSFVKFGDKLAFVCGNSYDTKSEYRIYHEQGMETAAFLYPDGGFRGWGSLFPIQIGSRTRYFWLTFDRHNGSDYNWSYGNLYCFEL